jgi:hypothetical protein
MSFASASPPPGSSGATVIGLADLRGLRSSPVLEEPQRRALRQELVEALRPYSWFTIGVMAADAAAAVACLRQLETALGWSPLAASAADPSSQGPSGSAQPGPVFLKGNQRTGTFLLRREEGLGEGELISGQNPEGSGAGETWGPLPLDLFQGPGSPQASAVPATAGP